MLVKCQVISDRADEYVGKRGLVKQQVLSLLDISDGAHRLTNTFDYTLTEPEKERLAGKLMDKVIVVGVREFVPFGGRLRARGTIVENSK